MNHAPGALLTLSGGPPSDGPVGLTLHDVLAEEPLRLTLLAGAHGRLNREVCGVVNVAAEDATPWVEQDWIVLTTGARLDDDPEAQQRFVSEIDEAGAAGLGYCSCEVDGSVPRAIVEEADRCGLPVFEVPGAMYARQTIAFVQKNLTSREVLAFSRMMALQRFLMDALGHDDPKRALIDRLAEFIGAKVGLLAPSGRFELSTGDLPCSAIHDCVAGKHLTTHFEAGDFHGHAFPVGDDESRLSWLVVAVPRKRALHPLAKPAGSGAVPLLNAINRLDVVERERDSSARRATFDVLLEAETPEAARVGAAHLAMAGIELSAGAVAVAIEDRDGDMSPDDLLDAVATAGGCGEWPMLLTVYDGCVLVLLQAPVPDEVVAALVSTAARPLRAGIGRGASDALHVRRSVAEAILAARADVGNGPVRRYDDLDFGTLVLQELQLERLAPKIEAWLGPLRNTPRVFDTLIAYLEHNLDVGSTADALHLHPNSVRYRLSRAEDLIGAPVRSPGTLIALHVAIATTTGGDPPAS